MRPFILAVALLATAATASAQSGTDLFLVHLKSSGDRAAVSDVVRLTHRAGYDNQPSFLQGTSLVLYTRIDSAGQADIWQYDLKTRETTPLTRTAPESEYSATPMPGSHRISVVRVERDSTQRLWSFTRAGTDPQIVVPNVKPVGYHAWLDAQHVVVFVLGKPATLQLVDIRTGATRVVASNVGRALQHIPGRNAFSFMQYHPDSTATITEYDVASGRTRPLVRAFSDNEFHAWLPSGIMVSGSGSTLYVWRPGAKDWRSIADLASHGVAKISRIAASADGTSLVVVGADE